MSIDRNAASRLLAIATVILFAMGVLSFLIHLSDLMSYGEVQGEISDIQTYSRSRYIGVQDMHRHRYIVKYTVNGREYENIVRKPSGDADIGTPVTVRYKRSDPSVILKDTRVLTEIPILWWIVGGVALLFRFLLNIIDRFDIFAESDR